MPPNRLFSLTSNFSVGDQRSWTLLQYKQNLIAASITYGTSNPTVLEKHIRQNNSTYWSLMVGLGGASPSCFNNNLTPCTFACNCDIACATHYSNCYIKGKIKYENGEVFCFCNNGSSGSNIYSSPVTLGANNSYGNQWTYKNSDGTIISCPACPS
jgi:hypothetical protein